MYRLGLDIGIKSVGWSVLECDENGEPTKILALNSRIFDAAEVPKTGASLAEPRRTARGTRRRLRRKVARLAYIRNLFERNNIFIFNESDVLQIKDDLKNIDILSLRVEALDKYISEEEFARVLYSIARHRGFKSNKKKGAQGKEDGELTASIKKNADKMQEFGYRTIGELLLKEYQDKGEAIHNKGGDYSKCVARINLENEIKLLFAKQKEFGNSFATDENCVLFLNYFSNQRSFDEGPGPGSQYSGSHPVRKCVFYRDLDCAAKGTYSNELATALQKVNNLKLIIDGEPEPISLTQEQRNKIILRAQEEKDGVTYKKVRDILGYKKDDSVRFSVLNYSVRKKLKKDGTADVPNPFKCEDAKFISFSNSNKIKNCLRLEFKDNIELIDAIAEICTKYTSENLFRKAIQEDNLLKNILLEEEIVKLLELDMTGYGHLSLKALREIIPYLQDGDVYSDACKKAGHNHSQFDTEKSKYLGKNKEVRAQIDEVTSPVVKRALSQTIKVIDAIIRKYGSPFAVNIELARDMSQTRQERDKADKENQERAADNARIKAKLQEEFGVRVSSTNLLKYRLYEEQNGKCAYSGESIDLNKLFGDDSYCEIDHIIPYSRSFDDSFNNKVLVLSKENQNKRNSTPYEYFSRIGRNWDEYESFVKTTYQYNKRKADTLLKKKVDEDGWKSRALNDTRYASRMLTNLVKDYLLFDENSKRRPVVSVNGRITSYLRRFWGIQKIREDGDKHHAVDATIIACVSPGIIQKLTNYNYAKESRNMKNGEYMLEDGELVSSEYYDKNSNLVLPYPYPKFRDELIARVADNAVDMEIKLRDMGMDDEYVSAAKPIVVSRMPHRKAKGTMHEATVWSSKYVANDNQKLHDGESIIVKRTPIENLKLDANGEIKGYFNPDSDKLLYNAIKQRLQEFGNDGKKAFAEPLYKPCANGQGNVVRTVKTYEKYYGGGMQIDKNKGIVANGSMVRVDLYSKDGKYYGVPVYTADVYKGVLPNRAATANKPRNEWRIIDETYTFEMSIYPNDLLRIESEKGIKMKKIIDNDSSIKENEKTSTDELVYYIKFGISTAAMTIEDTTGCYSAASVGIQNLGKITKCEIDVLGNVVEIKNKPKAPQPLHMKN